MERAHRRGQAAASEEGRALTSAALARELYWLALDEAGRVALFSTAGRGFVPDTVVEVASDYHDAIDEIVRMPECSMLQYAPSFAAHLENTWARAAAAGLFGFDADANGGGYRRVSAPRSPIHVSELPPAIAALAGRAVFVRVRFDASSILEAGSFG